MEIEYHCCTLIIHGLPHLILQFGSWCAGSTGVERENLGAGQRIPTAITAQLILVRDMRYICPHLPRKSRGQSADIALQHLCSELQSGFYKQIWFIAMHAGVEGFSRVTLRYHVVNLEGSIIARCAHNVNSLLQSRSFSA